MTTFLTDFLLEIKQARQAASPPSWTDGGQTLLSHTLLYAAKGRGELIINGERGKLARDGYYIFSPNTVIELSLSTAAPVELRWVIFDLFRIKERGEDQRAYERVLEFPVEGLIKLKGSRFKRLLYLLTAEQSGMRESSRFLEQHYLHEMLESFIAQAAPAAANDLEERLGLTLRYMQTHFREDIRVDKLAEIAQLHPSYYSQVFKKVMNKTPVAFLTDLRMNKAKELLLLTDKPIHDIAGDVGYGDEFYFSRRFKATSGYAPTVYTRNRDLKISSLSYAYTDHLFTLGLDICAAQVHRHLPIVTRELELPKHAVDPWEIGRQIFLEVQPDLFICKDNVLAKALKHVNDVAPIVGIPWSTMDIYSHMHELAELTGRQEAARKWLDRHERKAEQIRRSLLRSFSIGTTATICVARQEELRIYGTRNIGHVLYRSLQLSPPAKIREKLAQHAPGTGFNWVSIQPEELAGYEADYLFLAFSDEAEHKLLVELLKTNAVWRSFPAVKNDRVYFLDKTKWIVYAPYGIELQMEEARQLLLSPNRLSL
ncbi:helix-turn-helix domain-containing protein [Paenibacillus algorifonticola]|uniref:helix-turn-helix domain-containing protein n=1 Tax=Paenibacillus algorifonticola TaxID=684063 RepID=UPI003D286187